MQSNFHQVRWFGKGYDLYASPPACTDVYQKDGESEEAK